VGKADRNRTALARIVEKLPVDPSVLDDTIESNLCKGNIIQVYPSFASPSTEADADLQAMTGCQELDVWLAAHLGDVFDKLALIPDDEER
jgi:nuclear pore complex protein Nup85